MIRLLSTAIAALAFSYGLARAELLEDVPVADYRGGFSIGLQMLAENRNAAAENRAPLSSEFKAKTNDSVWITAMSKVLEARVPNGNDARIALLKAVKYEANRAELDPQVVLSVIDLASGFKKYAVSTEGARGLMQVKPSWIEKIGAPGDDLFGLRKNIRYGCVILRHFLDLENGDLLKALAHYRNQMGGLIEVDGDPIISAFDFPKAVDGLSKTRWRYDGL